MRPRCGQRGGRKARGPAGRRPPVKGGEGGLMQTQVGVGRKRVGARVKEERRGIGTGTSLLGGRFWWIIGQTFFSRQGQARVLPSLQRPSHSTASPPQSQSQQRAAPPIPTQGARPPPHSVSRRVRRARPPIWPWRWRGRLERRVRQRTRGRRRRSERLGRRLGPETGARWWERGEVEGEAQGGSRCVHGRRME